MSTLPADLAFDLGGAVPIAIDVSAQRDHAAEMLDRLPQQFRRKTDDPNNTENLLLACAGEFQALETAAQQVLTQRTIDTAIGQQLDDIGKLVGQARAGLDDDTYRRLVRARIKVHRSRGTAEDLLTIADLVVFDDSKPIFIQAQPVGTVVVRIDDLGPTTQLPDLLLNFLAAAAATGVRVILESGTDNSGNDFAFDDTPGFGFESGSFIDARD